MTSCVRAHRDGRIFRFARNDVKIDSREMD